MKDEDLVKNARKISIGQGGQEHAERLEDLINGTAAGEAQWECARSVWNIE